MVEQPQLLCFGLRWCIVEKQVCLHGDVDKAMEVLRLVKGRDTHCNPDHLVINANESIKAFWMCVCVKPQTWWEERWWWWLYPTIDLRFKWRYTDSSLFRYEAEYTTTTTWSAVVPRRAPPPVTSDVVHPPALFQKNSTFLDQSRFVLKVFLYL